jgi:hypothetical protein
MLIGDLVDTILNLGTFAFIAAMVWLLLRKPVAPPHHKSDKRKSM